MSRSSGKRRIFFVILALLLAGCQSTSASGISFRVELSPTLYYLTPAIQACALQTGNLRVILEEKPASEMGKTGANVSLVWGDYLIPAEGQAFRLGSDRLVFAGHKENPLEILKLEQALFLYRGGYTTWTDALKEFCPNCVASDTFANRLVEAWHYPPGEDIFMEVKNLMPASENVDLGNTWLAPGAKNVSQAITDNPAAIGWLPARWLNQNLKEISIEGIDPSAQIIPVLAITPGNPLEDTQKWLQCLQTTFGN